MKVHIELECTPEEARRAVGLPDLTPIHDRYVAMVMETMQGQVQPEMIETLMRGWQPMGEAGMTLWKSMFDSVGKGS